MIAIQNLVKRFGSFTAVDGVDIEARAGEIHGFLGPNGAGKTTDHPDRGRVAEADVGPHRGQRP